MIIKTEVGEGWIRWKQNEPITPGTYYQVCKKGRLEDKFKKSFGMIAAQNPAGRFYWLAPFEPWVKRALLGMLDMRNWDVKPRIEIDWKLFDSFHLFYGPDSLRKWQLEFVADAYNAAAHGLPYRRAAVVPLGGGKTLAGLLIAAFGERSVVIAPKYLHETWRTEAEKFYLPVPRLSTYESAHKVSEADVVIIDEVLALKDSSTLRANKVKKLCENAEIVVGFTGTPIGARGPLDWRWLCTVVPGSVPSGETQWRFLWGVDTKLVEVAPGRNAYVTKCWDEDRIANFVAPFLYTVSTEDIRSELPELSFQTIKVERPEEYEKIRAGVASDGTRSKILAQTRQCSDGFVLRDSGEPYEIGSEKIKAIQEFVEGLGEPAVIMATWDHSVTMLERAFEEQMPAVIRGGMSEKELEEAITRFKSGETRVLIANSRFSQGMNLQETARVLIFMSWSTNPVDRQQAIGRIYRPGQKNGCIVVDVIAENTLDSRTVELISAHNALSQSQIEKLLESELK